MKLILFVIFGSFIVCKTIAQTTDLEKKSNQKKYNNRIGVTALPFFIKHMHI